MSESLSPSAAGDPFSPREVEFRSVSTGLITARLITAGIVLLPPLIAGILIAVLVTPWLWLPVAVLAAIGLWLLWLIPRQIRVMGYAERDEDLFIRKGILFRQLTVVPYGRMQFVEVEAGPLLRRCGIATVKLHTASATTDATIPPLPPAEAERLRDRLTERGEARLAGL